MGTLKISSVLAVVFLGLFASFVDAQERITVKVPFAFVVGHESFPAGTYELRNQEGSAAVFALLGTKNPLATFMMTLPADGPAPSGDQPALVFTRYEDTYRLSQIWESSDYGHTLTGASAGSDVARAEKQVGRSRVETRVVYAS